jgi:hypothetical protein
MRCRTRVWGGTRSSRLKAASLIVSASLAGCAQEAAVLVSEPGPLALHVLPGAGFSLTSASTLYLVVVTEDLRARTFIPELSTIIASELRTAAGVNVVPLVDPGLDRPPCTSWRETCQQYGLPIPVAEPGAAVVVCDLQEIDSYSPLRVGLALTVRRIDDGLNLAGVQGVWVGPAARLPPPPHSFWSLPRIRHAVPEPDWTEAVESGTSAQLMRRAARDAVQSLLISPTGSASSVIPMMPPADPEPLVEDVPPMPAAEPGPALPAQEEVTEPWFNESAESVPAGPGPSL